MKHLVIGLAALLLAVLVTIPKLYRMLQIKGIAPGAVVTTEVITEKWHQTAAEHPRGRDVYWISYGPASIREVGGHRQNIGPEQWRSLEIGQPIEIIRIPGDRLAYIKDDIFVSPGNFAFDIVLLTVELTVAIGALVAWRRARRAASRTMVALWISAMN